MKIRIILSYSYGEQDEQTIETSSVSNWGNSAEIIEALKAWPLAPGDTIKSRRLSDAPSPHLRSMENHQSRRRVRGQPSVPWEKMSGMCLICGAGPDDECEVEREWR